MADETFQPATEDQVRASFSGPAVHVNKIFVTLMSAGMRLTFAEAQGDVVPSQYRAAVLLSYQDALALRDILSSSLKEFEQEFKKTKAIHG